MRLLPNLLGMFVYADDACPRFDPPKLIGDGARWYINTLDVDAFYAWEVRKRPIELKYQFPYPVGLFGIRVN